MACLKLGTKNDQRIRLSSTEESVVDSISSPCSSSDSLSL